jgi:hypothetical protein
VVGELPRGTVTFLFTDIDGSTRLLHELGESYVEALADHRRVLRSAFARPPLQRPAGLGAGPSKTLTDPVARLINLRPRATIVRALRRFCPPRDASPPFEAPSLGVCGASVRGV